MAYASARRPAPLPPEPPARRPEPRPWLAAAALAVVAVATVGFAGLTALDQAHVVGGLEQEVRGLRQQVEQSRQQSGEQWAARSHALSQMGQEVERLRREVEDLGRRHDETRQRALLAATAGEGAQAEAAAVRADLSRLSDAWQARARELDERLGRELAAVQRRIEDQRPAAAGQPGPSIPASNPAPRPPAELPAAVASPVDETERPLIDPVTREVRQAAEAIPDRIDNGRTVTVPLPRR